MNPLTKQLSIGMIGLGKMGSHPAMQAAVDKEISVPFIALAVMELFESRGSGRDSARVVALLRHGYGGHPFGNDEHIAEERKTSRLTKL